MCVFICTLLLQFYVCHITVNSPIPPFNSENGVPVLRKEKYTIGRYMVWVFSLELEGQHVRK